MHSHLARRTPLSRHLRLKVALGGPGTPRKTGDVYEYASPYSNTPRPCSKQKNQFLSTLNILNAWTYQYDIKYITGTAGLFDRAAFEEAYLYGIRVVLAARKAQECWI